MLAIIITLILLFAIFGVGAYWVFKNTNVYTAPAPAPTPAPTPTPSPISVEPFHSFSPSASSANRHSVVGGCCGLGV